MPTSIKWDDNKIYIKDLVNTQVSLYQGLIGTFPIFTTRLPKSRNGGAYTLKSKVLLLESVAKKLIKDFPFLTWNFFIHQNNITIQQIQIDKFYMNLSIIKT